MGGSRGRGRNLVWLFGRARDPRNARRGAAGAVTRPFARALRRRRQARGRLAAPLRRRLFPSRRSRAAFRRRAQGRAFVRVAGAVRRRCSAAPIRRGLRELARTAAGEVKLICSHDPCRFFRDEERAARSPSRAPTRQHAAARPAARPPREALRTIGFRPKRSSLRARASKTPVLRRAREAIQGVGGRRLRSRRRRVSR